MPIIYDGEKNFTRCEEKKNLHNTWFLYLSSRHQTYEVPRSISSFLAFKRLVSQIVFVSFHILWIAIYIECCNNSTTFTCSEWPFLIVDDETAIDAEWESKNHITVKILIYCVHRDRSKQFSRFGGSVHCQVCMWISYFEECCNIAYTFLTHFFSVFCMCWW